MSPNEVSKLVEAQPFSAFRIHVSDGKSYEITHPDQVMIFPAKLIIGVGRQNGSRILSHAEHCSLLHVTRLEESSA